MPANMCDHINFYLTFKTIPRKFKNKVGNRTTSNTQNRHPVYYRNRFPHTDRLFVATQQKTPKIY